MTAPQTTATTDPQSIAALQRMLDAALAREAALTEELAARTTELLERKSEFDERIEYEAATVGVLKAMSASPSDTLPVFNLITRRAAELCESSIALYELREGQLNYMAGHGMDLETMAAFRQSFPRPVDGSLVAGRAILERRIVHVQNVAGDTALSQVARDLGGTAIVAIPLLRNGEPIGAVALNGKHPGGFSDSQIELLRTFAEQAVIAISSAETYRALHEACVRRGLRRCWNIRAGHRQSGAWSI
jgi:two-component system NtrC family sensor kinase